MRKSLLLGLLVVSGSIGAVSAQSSIVLDNYNTSGPVVTYGAPGIPANGISGPAGVVGTGLQAGWTLGFYYALGDVRGSILPDPSGLGIPLGGGLALATGLGSTAEFFTSTGGAAGEVFNGVPFLVPGTSLGGGDTITIVAVAYTGSSYTTANWRSHSNAFLMTTASNIQLPPNKIGDFMPAFSVFPLPEPSPFALLGVGFAFLFFCRKRGFFEGHKSEFSKAIS
jgi:hypothetical protein